MRKIVAVTAAVALVAGAAVFVSLPDSATAQGAGTVEVEVTYNGAPQVETLKINKDVEVCGKEAKIEKIVVGGNKGLQHAVASVAGAKGPATGKKVSLDQKNCQFVPHVLGTTPGEVDILNSDGVLHNLHTFSTANPPVNKAQPKFKKEMVEKLEKPELIKVQCDAHSWMLGWIYVTENPTAVTDGNGAFKLENVPPGKHKVEVVHPVLGKQTKEVEVKAGQDTKVAFELKK